MYLGFRNKTCKQFIPIHFFQKENEALAKKHPKTDLNGDLHDKSPEDKESTI